MRVPRDRARPCEAAHVMPVRRRQHGRTAVCCVDVQPQIAGGNTDVGNGVQVVETSCGRATGRRHHSHHRRARAAQRPELSAERVCIHREVARWHDHHARHAEPHFPGRARDGVVRVLAADEHWRIVPHAVHPNVGHRGTARRQQCAERCFRATGGHGATGAIIPSDQIRAPAHDLSLKRRERR